MAGARDFKQGVEFSHYLCRNHLNPGDMVVDATCGRGEDTVFLAELVGKEGFVAAFDIQRQAVEKTAAKLQARGLQSRVELINDGHENMEEYLSARNVDGVLFNLGFLPGSNKEIITSAKTTIPALKVSLKLLNNNGIVILVVYTGHKGGERELESLLAFTEKLDYHQYNVLHYHFINQKSPPPQVIAIKARD